MRDARNKTSIKCGMRSAEDEIKGHETLLKESKSRYTFFFAARRSHYNFCYEAWLP